MCVNVWCVEARASKLAVTRERERASVVYARVKVDASGRRGARWCCPAP